MAIFQVGDRVLYGSQSAWLESQVIPVGSVGTVTAVYDLGDEFYDGVWGTADDGSEDDPGYEVDFGALSGNVSFVIEEENLYSNDRGVYKVERKVDTVIVEMDESVATALCAILNRVTDGTSMGTGVFGSAIYELRSQLQDEEKGGVRRPSRRYDIMVVEADGFNKHQDRIHLLDARG